MSHSSSPVATHPVVACAAAMEKALDDVTGLDPVFMDVPAQREALLVLDRLASRVTALQARVIAASGEVAAAEGHRDVAAWMTHRTRRDRSTHRRLQRLARSCEDRWHDLGTALGLGTVNTDQGHAIARALDDLDRTLADLASDARIQPPVTPDRRAEVLDAAQTHLLDQAARFGPRELARLGARILHVVAPHLEEDAEGRRLDHEDRHARRVTSLTTRRLGDGTTKVTARVPDHVAARLVTSLEAFTNPRHDRTPGGSRPTPDATGEALPYDLRLGAAFCALLEGLDPTRLPLHGGNATQLVITMNLADLLKDLGTATLGHGHGHGREQGDPISAGEVRRLACTADLVPAVLGTRSEPLDLGRTTRLFSPAQRKALALRDHECRADGCSIPAAWCEAHHLTPWARDGATDLDNGLLLCSHHHHRIHDDRYLHQRLPNGDVRYSRRR